ncbi:hypothetical protein P2H44_22970 [Albimonas sp. CAU 1670]|uniref:hypothetical protein n=1 Tax=Albimonas sp. CAU 1670 TaxID=3032599 RepID=UPI0023DBE308|nr:hypothetical protein [Albimonas sp. CAU 1670]MDF2235428.1 hypothetical protein [Albimonas sp. CAU 1670]
MPRPGVFFSHTPPPAQGLSARADVAMVAGLLARRPGPVPEALLAALEAAGWAGAGPFARSPEAVEALLDCPVAVESWDEFDALFDWRGRTPSPGDERPVPSPTGLAVRSFFAQGGRRAWIVRTGDPLPVVVPGEDAASHRATRALRLSLPFAQEAAADFVPLLPGLGGVGRPVSAQDPATWRGAAHLLGIDEAAMLLLPDLPELCAGPPAPAAVLPSPPPPPEAFRPCGPLATDEAATPAPLPLSAPRLDAEGFALWARALRHALALAEAPGGAHHRRDAILIASLPRPAPGAGEALAPLETLAAVEPIGDGTSALSESWLGSRRLQLAYPWIATPGAASAPEGLEGAEGIAAGLIARSALALGAHRSAAGRGVTGATRLSPELGSGELARGLAPGAAGGADWAGDRLTLVARGTSGFRLVSDATAAVAREGRAGGVSRLIGVIERAARELGQAHLFEPSGEALWAETRAALTGLMERLREAGAFAGAPGEAYTVRCGRDTMSQADLDAGRVIAEVSFRAAQPIQQVRVTLALGRAREAQG